MHIVEEKFGQNIYKLIFDHSPEAIVVLDSVGRFIAANGRLYDWIRIKPEDAIGKNILTMRFLPAKSKAIVAAKFAQRIAGADIDPYDLEFFDKDGLTKVGRIIGTPIRDNNGKIIGDLVMISEVTEIKKVEYALQEKVKELEQLNNLMVDRELKMVELKEKLKHTDKTH